MQHLQQVNPKDPENRAYEGAHGGQPAGNGDEGSASSENQFFQPIMVVNYPGPDVPYTRIVEYKHVPNQTQAVEQCVISV